MNNVVFTKGVLDDYSSLYARGKLEHIYAPGTRHTFSEALPAYCNCALKDNSNLVGAWIHRAEAYNAKRLLICYGNHDHKKVRIAYVASDSFREVCRTGELPKSNWYIQDTANYISTDFEVIGEIFVPSNW